MSAVVALQWAKNDAVVHEYLAAVPSHVYAWNESSRFGGVVGAMSATDIGAVVGGARRSELREDGARRAGQVLSSVREIAGATADRYANGLSERVTDVLVAAEALSKIHHDQGIDIIVLNEDVMHVSKAAALWGAANNVPVVSIAHSSIMGRLYTVHRGMDAGIGTVFGARGAVPYVDANVAKKRIAVTGNPAWDRYPALAAERSQVRSAVRGALQIPDGTPMIVFATTWAANLTTMCDENAYERTLRAFLEAARELGRTGAAPALIVKDRPSNSDRRAETYEIVRAVGVPGVQLVDDNLPELLVACDLAVSVDSNVSVEAMLAGVPAVNLWTPESWYNGPFFDAADGVVEASSERLCAAMERLLSDAAAREEVLATQRSRVGEFAASVGRATRRTADVIIGNRRPARTHRARFVWEELTNPTSALEKGGTAEYYNHARHELVALLRKEPRVVLDVGCAGGATGAVVKAQYPRAVVHGVELSDEAASIAASRIDRVLRENVEKMDFAAAGFSPHGIDTVFLPDVLEHLYDPWNLLVRLKPFLSEDAQVVASIPNVRNFWLLSQLLRGSWDYVEEGLLDVTHIRFFTAKSVRQLFEQTGYRVVRTSANIDPRVPVMTAQPGCTANVDTPTLTLKQLSQSDLDELRTLQFLVDAVPV